MFHVPIEFDIQGEELGVVEAFTFIRRGRLLVVHSRQRPKREEVSIKGPHENPHHFSRGQPLEWL